MPGHLISPRGEEVQCHATERLPVAVGALEVEAGTAEVDTGAEQVLAVEVELASVYFVGEGEKLGTVRGLEGGGHEDLEVEAVAPHEVGKRPKGADSSKIGDGVVSQPDEAGGSTGGSFFLQLADGGEGAGGAVALFRGAEREENAAVFAEAAVPRFDAALFPLGIR